MKPTHVEGKRRRKVMLYALSTCIWCRKTKTLLKELGVDHYIVDVDLLEGAEKDKVLEDVRKYNPACTFPTIVLDDDECINGYKPEMLKELLGP